MSNPLFEGPEGGLAALKAHLRWGAFGSCEARRGEPWRKTPCRLEQGQGPTAEWALACERAANAQLTGATTRFRSLPTQDNVRP